MQRQNHGQSLGEDLPILDHTQLEVLRSLDEQGDVDIIAELEQDFNVESATRMLELGQAVATQDGKRIEFVAHSLGSICGNLGGARMMAACRRLERKGQLRALDGAAELLDEISREHACFAAALSAYRAQGSQ